MNFTPISFQTISRRQTDTVIHYAQRILIGFVFIFCALCSANATAYTDAERHFSLSLPKGWREIPYDTVQAHMREVARITKSQMIHYIAGFQMTENLFFQYPYILVQEHTVASASFADVKNALDTLSLDSASNDLENKLSEFVDSLSFDHPTIDKKRAAVFITMKADVAGIGKIYGFIVMLLGKERVIQLNCYCLADEIIKWRPVFRSIIISFAYDSGYGYDSSASHGPLSRLNVKIALLIGAIMIGFLVGRFQKRRSSMSQ